MSFKLFSFLTVCFILRCCFSNTVNHKISDIIKARNLTNIPLLNDEFRDFCDEEDDNDTLCTHVYNFLINCTESKNTWSYDYDKRLEHTVFSKVNRVQFCALVNGTYESPRICRTHCFSYVGRINPPCLLFLNGNYSSVLKFIPRKYVNNQSNCFINIIVPRLLCRNCKSAERR